MLAIIRAVAALPFAVAATAGFVASVAVHLYALMGRQPPYAGPALMMVLHAGIFVVFVPGILFGAGARRDEQRDDGAQGVAGGRSKAGDVRSRRTLRLEGPAKVFGVVTAVLFVYAFVNFIVGLIGTAVSRGSASDPVLMYRLFSGHWMLFYWVSLMMLASAVAGAMGGRGMRCVNGHRVPPGSVSCPVCGQPPVASAAGGQGGVEYRRDGRSAGKDNPPDLPTIVR